MIDVWRIIKSRYADTAFDGEGARRSGGRWNSPGRALIYTSSTLSLAVLEIFVHLRNKEILSAYSVIPARVPAGLIQDLGDLPENWRTYPAPPALQLLGDAWIESGSSAALRVPSAIVESEYNYLLNPAHGRFGEIEIGSPRPFAIDPRLLR
ncbi:MAG TPA: RES family NAD+ phosphorylase [Thermoanaerobaculia bacterium]|nr:RES family NAD+ phosphorylase [Thermoanaerobaculia bacterium]